MVGPADEVADGECRRYPQWPNDPVQDRIEVGAEGQGEIAVSGREHEEQCRVVGHEASPCDPGDVGGSDEKDECSDGERGPRWPGDDCWLIAHP